MLREKLVLKVRHRVVSKGRTVEAETVSVLESHQLPCCHPA